MSRKESKLMMKTMIKLRLKEIQIQHRRGKQSSSVFFSRKLTVLQGNLAYHQEEHRMVKQPQEMGVAVVSQEVMFYIRLKKAMRA